MIFNLTQHDASREQLAAGVQPRSEGDAKLIRDLITFDSPPDIGEMRKRATSLAEIVLERLEATPRFALIGGATYFMSTLETVLKKHGVIPLHSFSQRVIHEEALPDGTVKKSGVFRHLGFICEGRFANDPGDFSND